VGRIQKLTKSTFRTQFRESPCFIVSFDLGNESYQEIFQPDYGEVGEDNFLTLGVLRDCLSISSGHVVWI